MALFELTGTRLEATALGEPVEAAQRQTVLGAVRGQLVDVLRRPVFPSVWEREGDADVLTALDAASQVMCVELLERLDAAALVAAMARTAAAAQSGWTDLAARVVAERFSLRAELPGRVGSEWRVRRMKSRNRNDLVTVLKRVRVALATCAPRRRRLIALLAPKSVMPHRWRA